MATSFDRWEKDPFFAAAEEVQDAADRMESVYRQWIYSRKVPGESAGGDGSFASELQRELHLALGTAKWQLEEFERAVKVSDETSSVGEAARTRHSQFFAALGNRISGVENSLRQSSIEAGHKHLAWVQLDEGERDELARFLSWPAPEREEGEEEAPVSSVADLSFTGNNLVGRKGNSTVENSKRSFQSQESSLRDLEEKKEQGYRRAASSAGDVGAWTVTVPSEDEDTSDSDDRPVVPAFRVLSFSAPNGPVESSSGTKWYNNGFRKWRGRCQRDVTELFPLRSNQLNQDIEMCYERSESFLSSCEDDMYHKQLHGCLGALHRLIQRSQYQVQYGRPIQIIFWVALFVLLVVLLVLRLS